MKRLTQSRGVFDTMFKFQRELSKQLWVEGSL